MDKKELLEYQTGARKAEAIAAKAGNKVALAALAAERVGRDQIIRERFGRLFTLCGIEAEAAGPEETSRMTKSIVVQRASEERAQIVALITAAVGEENHVDIVTTFHEEDTPGDLSEPFTEEIYRQNRVVLSELSWPGGYADHALIGQSGIRQARRIVEDMHDADESMQNAENTLDMLEEAVRDPNLNPVFAQKVAMEQPRHLPPAPKTQESLGPPA